MMLSTSVLMSFRCHLPLFVPWWRLCPSLPLLLRLFAEQVNVRFRNKNGLSGADLASGGEGTDCCRDSVAVTLPLASYLAQATAF